MAYRLSGKILSVGQTQTLTSKSGNSYDKRDLVVTVIKYDPYTGYPSEDPGNTPKFSFIGQRCHDLDGMKAGDTVTIGFELSGRSYEKDGRTEYMTDVRPVSVYRNSRDVIPSPEAAPAYQAPSGAVNQGPSDPFAASPSPATSAEDPFAGHFSAYHPANPNKESKDVRGLADDLPF